MSGAFVATSAGASAAAARARRVRMMQEEEDMTRYEKDDLEGWEFKIVRSATRKFKKYQVVQKVCQEESKAGWELVEKFDDSRLRLKRKIENRANDHLLETDPYRTTVGISEGSLGGISAGVIVAIVGGGVLGARMLKN